MLVIEYYFDYSIVESDEKKKKVKTLKSTANLFAW